MRNLHRFTIRELHLVKITFLFFLIIIWCRPSFGFQAIKWYPFMEGIEKASTEKKLLLVSIFDSKRLNEKNNDQRQCTEYKNEYLPYDASLHQYINDFFIPVVIDVSKALTVQEKELLDKLKFTSGKVKFVREKGSPDNWLIPAGAEIFIVDNNNIAFKTVKDAISKEKTKEVVIPVVGLYPGQERIEPGVKFSPRGLPLVWNFEAVESVSSFSINTYYDNCTFALADQSGNIITDKFGNQLYTSNKNIFKMLLKDYGADLKHPQAKLNAANILWYPFIEGIEKASTEKKLLLVSITDPKQLNVKNTDQRRCVDKRNELLRDYPGRNPISDKAIPAVIDISKSLTKEEKDFLNKLKFSSGKVKFGRDTGATEDYIIPAGTIVRFAKARKVEFRTATEAILRGNTKEVVVPVVGSFQGQEQIQVAPGDPMMIIRAVQGVSWAVAATPFSIISYFDNCTFALADQDGTIIVDKFGNPIFSNNLEAFQQIIRTYTNY